MRNKITNQTKNNNYLLKKTLWIVVFVLTVQIVFAQSLTVKGKVKDTQGAPILGATILVLGTTTGTLSDFEGNFTITVPNSKSVIKCSYIGMEPQTFVVGNQLFPVITLNESAFALSEVVAIGYGAAKKGSVTGSIVQVNSRQLENRSVLRVDQALAGQMAGVSVKATTGDLGAPLQISIRGKTSVSATNEPLYVVDGVPTTDISDLIISDVESINVLKDASSSAIYGSRGANGVVIITTKSGKSGKTKFTFGSYFGVQSLEKKIDLLSSQEWINLDKEVIDARWVKRGKELGKDWQATDSYEYRLSQLGSFNKSYMYDPLWQYGTDSLALIDWQDELYRVAPIQEYQLSASGGSKNINYHISGTYLKQDGIIKYTSYNKINFRSNLSVKFNDKLSLDFTLSPTSSVNNGGLTTGKDMMVHRALSMAPVADKKYGTETGVYPNTTYLFAGSSCSPVAYLREITYRQEDSRMRTNLALNYEIFKGLKARFSGSMDDRNIILHRYMPTKVQSSNASATEGQLSTALLTSQRISNNVFESTLNYNTSLSKHNLDFLAGYSIEDKHSDRATQKHTQFNNDILTTFSLNNSTVSESSYELYDDRLMSYFARGQYDYDNRYLLNMSLRRDGSSRFGKDNLWGTFPSFSVGWRVSNEKFMSKIEFVSSMKLRYSFGMTGNNSIPLYRSFAELATSNYSFGNQIAYGYANGTLENTDLGWEKTNSSNFGIDLGVLKNRLFLSFDYYYKKTSNMLYYVPVAAVTGFTNGWQNIGSMQNNGYELELTTHNLNGKFKWDTNINFSHNSNKVLSLGPDNTPILSGFENKTTILKVGLPMYSYYMYDAIGVYMNQADLDNSPKMSTNIVGDIKYRDANEDGIINENDKTIVGKPEPDFFWGLTNTFRYKNFDLSILLQGQQGGKIYGIIGRAYDNSNGETSINRPAHWKNRWQSEENPGNGIIPRIDGTTSGLYDSRWLYDATYWKVKNVTLTYNLPKNTIKNITAAQIYFSGDNLFMRDHYEIGYSPEAENNAGGDYGGYPLARVLTLGVKMTF
ncbi:MAG: TonB-dependent receptor [Paludibacter sp.]|nr:TonB-dependent receptor [Paludibacter sp.]